MLGQEKYRSHTVQKGETVSSLSRLYDVSKATIYQLNPNAAQGIQENMVLILPSDDLVITNTAQMKFKKHRVRRRETLFSISQKYNVSQDDIKKYNNELYSRQLKKGERIQIPLGLETSTKVVIKPKNPDPAIISPKGGKHTVESKETKYGIARKYGITIAELEELNPDMGKNLGIGTILKVPMAAVVGSATIEEDKFDFYEVLKQEGFYRLKVKLGLSQEAIVALNPYAKEGLTEGMILKIPKKNNTINAAGTAMTVDLESLIWNRSEKRIAVMLPFQLQKVVGDSIDRRIDLLKDNSIIRVSLDFHSGILMALEFAKDKGISTILDVYDTQGSDMKTSRIIAENDFEDVDAVIGPLLQKNVEKAALELKRTGTPVFSPLSNRAVKMSSNLFQTLPTDAMLSEKMLNYLKQNESGKNFLLISDAKKAASKKAVLAALPNAKTIMPREKGFLYETDIFSNIDPLMENWVILETADPVIVSNVVNLLRGMPEDSKIRLFTLDKNDAFEFDDISNRNLAKLNFTFPSFNKSYNYKDKDAFLVSYKNEYGVLPNRYAVRGFDITYDILLRLASADDIYDAASSDYETEYIENKFRYSKQLFSGYQNNASYIIKYTHSLQFEVVE